MKICGIICEFNPLHNGHEYLIREAKALGYTVICLMSGNWTQRGLPASIEKYTRAKTAIQAGASVVLELPFIYSVNSADHFAKGAIEYLKALGVNTIIFGSENNNKEKIEKLAEFKLNEPKAFKKLLKQHLENGLSYNNAYLSAIKEYSIDNDLITLNSSPNDILASSYVKEIKKQKANIDYIVIKRQDNGYNSKKSSQNFLSASSILSLKKDNKDYSQFLPPFSQTELEKSPAFDYEKYFAIIKNNILQTKTKNLSKIFGVEEGLEFLLNNQVQFNHNFISLLQNIQSKRYRESRMRKILLYSAIFLTKKEYKKAEKSKLILSCLAVKKSDKNILSILTKTKVKILITGKDYKSIKNRNKHQLIITQKADTLYSICTNTPLSQFTRFVD